MPVIHCETKNVALKSGVTKLCIFCSIKVFLKSQNEMQQKIFFQKIVWELLT